MTWQRTEIRVHEALRGFECFIALGDSLAEGINCRLPAQLHCWDWLPPPMSTECRDFFLRPASVRERLFSTYDLNKQLELYRCGMNRRPPDSSLPLLIAEKGEASIPTLLDKLEGEKDELFQYGIIDIFVVMSVKGYLRDRRDVVDRIRRVVSKMKISTFREMAEKSLNKIEQNSGN